MGPASEGDAMYLLRQGEQRLLSLGQVHDVPGRRHVLADVLGGLDPPEKE